MVVREALGKTTWKPQRIKLTKDTVLIVDEASQAGNPHLARLIELVHKAGAKLVLAGDPRQGQAINAPGGAFKSLVQRYPSSAAELSTIVRQREKWARDAVQFLSSGGKAREVLKAFSDRAQLTVAPNRHEAKRQLVDTWSHGGVKKPHEHLMLAATNQECSELNRMAQQIRINAGELGGTLARKSPRRTLLLGEETLHEGDRILFTKNSSLGLRNGHLATVLRIDALRRTLRVQLDEGEALTVPLRHYGVENCRLGYAVTVARSQGMTVPGNAYVLTGGQMTDRELGVVSISRAREKTFIFTDRFEAGKGLEDLARQLDKSRQKSLAHDVRDQARDQARGMSNCT
jgi:ATP-dependent exoDNAse (exonuclease V) alpha subunit